MFYMRKIGQTIGLRYKFKYYYHNNNNKCNSMTMILQKYKSKRKLGKGAYGDVLLCEDPDGKQIAIKMINKKIIQKDPFLEQYLQGEKEVMTSVKSIYIMELYDFQQDQNYKYFLCEYCDGGDLLNYQAKQTNKVFDLKTATLILSQVINGLQLLHRMEYLHRDIKPQNILLKKTNQEGKYLFKLADFGFCKKNTDVGGTVLGTQHYMSPEIYSGQNYDREVDMWAFGVLFYFMLNMEFPFRINPHAQIQQKRQQLIKQATNFSYAQQVKKSKKKIMENCTPEVQDLFRKIFLPDGARRINFIQIRQHPVFREHFPVIQHQSRIVYNKKKLNRYDSFVQNVKSGIHIKKNSSNGNNTPANLKNEIKKQENKDEIFENATPSLFVKKVGNTGDEKAILQAELDRINFLSQTSDQLSMELKFVDDSKILSFRYNTLKYYVVLMRQFCSQLKAETLDKKYPKLKWKQFSKTGDFNSIKTQAKQKLDSAEIKVSQCYDECKNDIARISKLNPNFETCLQSEVTEKQLEGTFKLSYRISTNAIFEAVRQKLSSGNKFVYMTALVVMIHAFNQLNACTANQLQNLFPQFVNQRKLQGKPIEYSELKNWLSTSDKIKIKGVIKNLIKAFLS